MWAISGGPPGSGREGRGIDGKSYPIDSSRRGAEQVAAVAGDRNHLTQMTKMPEENLYLPPDPPPSATSPGEKTIADDCKIYQIQHGVPIVTRAEILPELSFGVLFLSFASSDRRCS
jgi:hypothetical protein